LWAIHRLQAHSPDGVPLLSLLDAARRKLVSQHAGVRAILVHALNDRARQFYEHYGFTASPVHPMTLMVRLSERR